MSLQLKSIVRSTMSASPSVTLCIDKVQLFIGRRGYGVREYSARALNRKIVFPFFVYRDGKLILSGISDQLKLRVNEPGKYTVSLVPYEVLSRLPDPVRFRLADEFEFKTLDVQIRAVLRNVGRIFYSALKDRCFDVPLTLKTAGDIVVADESYKVEAEAKVPEMWAEYIAYAPPEYLPMHVWYGWRRNGIDVVKKSKTLTSSDYYASYYLRVDKISLPDRLCAGDEFWIRSDRTESEIIVGINIEPDIGGCGFSPVGGALRLRYALSQYFREPSDAIKYKVTQIKLSVPVFSDTTATVPIEAQPPGGAKMEINIDAGSKSFKKTISSKTEFRLRLTTSEVSLS